MKKLFLVHCGFYDLNLCDGIYEGHANFFVIADDFEDARAQAKLISEFKEKRMHVDGLQEITAVMGHKVSLTSDVTLEGKTVVTSSRHRDLATRK